MQLNLIEFLPLQLLKPFEDTHLPPNIAANDWAFSSKSDKHFCVYVEQDFIIVSLEIIWAS